MITPSCLYDFALKGHPKSASHFKYAKDFFVGKYKGKVNLADTNKYTCNQSYFRGYYSFKYAKYIFPLWFSKAI